MGSGVVPEPICSLQTLTTFFLQILGKAEREGFEPSRRLNTAYAISNRAPSANSDTSPGATDGSLPKSESAATAESLVRVLAFLCFGCVLLLGSADRVAQGEGGKEEQGQGGDGDEGATSPQVVLGGVESATPRQGRRAALPWPHWRT